MLLQGVHGFGKEAQWRLMEDGTKQTNWKNWQKKDVNQYWAKNCPASGLFRGTPLLLHVPQNWSKMSIKSLLSSKYPSNYLVYSGSLHNLNPVLTAGWLVFEPIAPQHLLTSALLPLAYCALMSLSWPCGWSWPRSGAKNTQTIHWQGDLEGGCL